MKKLLLSISTLFIALSGFAQDKITVCHTASTDKFAMFASNKKFNAEHPNPRVYVHISEEGGQMIHFKTPDGGEANAYFIEAKKKTNNWVFVFQEWWGLNDNIKRHADEIYKDLGNVNVLALDMYDGKMATDADNAGKLMQAFKQERGDMIVKGAVAYAGKDAKIGTVGYCFGGGQSLLASLTAGKQAVACVMYYGMPVSDVNVLKTLNCDVLNIWGTKDQWINKKVSDTFEQNMKLAGKNLTNKAYEAAHGFANPSNPMGSYDEASAKDAYKNTLDFFKARLK